MSDSTANLTIPSPNFSDLPLPERIAKEYNFALAYHDIDDKRYYAVQDWISGVTQSPEPRTFWTAMKRRLKKVNIDVRTWCTQLPYQTSNGKTYKMDHADAETLYKITQRMDANTGLRNDILAYLANAGVVLDEMYRDGDTADKVVAELRETREYNRMMAEGFPPHEAIQWLQQRASSILTRKWITSIWNQQGARAKDYGRLTNQISIIVHGKSVTQRKREMGLAKHDTPRNYDPAADQLLTEIAELSSGRLHLWRGSDGVDELSEDIEDTRPLVDSAKPHAYSMFSKRRRKLPHENKPTLSEPKQDD